VKKGKSEKVKKFGGALAIRALSLFRIFTF